MEPQKTASKTPDTSPKEHPQFAEVNRKQLEEELNNIIESMRENRNADLIRFGRDHGFLNCSLRARAYMALLDISYSDIEDFNEYITSTPLMKKDEIIENDSARSFLGFKELANLPESDLQNQRKELSLILNLFFQRYPNLSYYQGLNSFGEVLLIYFGKSLASLILERWCLKYLKQYLSNDEFEHEIKRQMYIALKILEKELPEYKEILKIEGDINDHRVAQERLGFIVSWIVTWFAYRMKSLDSIFRNFDFLLCSPRHTVSIMVALVIRHIILKDKLSVNSPYEQVLLSFYSCDLDHIQWEQLIRQAMILGNTDDYRNIDYVNGGGKGLASIVKGFSLPWGKGKKGKGMDDSEWGLSHQVEEKKQKNIFQKVTGLFKK